MLDFEYAALAVAKVGACLLALVIVALAAFVVLVRSAWEFKRQYRKLRPLWLQQARFTADGN